MIKSIVSILLLLTSFQLMGQHIRKIPSEKPKLIVFIMVDQMRYEYLNRFSGYFGNKGFKKLEEQGSMFHNAHFNYMYNQNGVGEATISTGSQPKTHGIIGSSWYERLTETIVQCTEDPKYLIVGNKAKGHAPSKLHVTSFTDELKLNYLNSSKVFGVSLNPSSSVLLSGHSSDAAFWYDETTGNWITSNYYMEKEPDWVKTFNKRGLPELYLNKTWGLFAKSQAYKLCNAELNDFETGIRGHKMFPYDIPKISNVVKGKTDFSVLKTTPHGNVYTKDFAISLIVSEELGKDDTTDVLFVGFNSTEEIGSRFGARSRELMDVYLRLDEEIAHFIAFLETEIGRENCLIVLTSNHGVSEVPGLLKQQKVPVDYFKPTVALSVLKSYLSAVYGKGDWIDHYYRKQIFLNRKLIEDAKINLADIQNKTAQFLIQFSGVANATTSSIMESTNYTQGINFQFQNGYHQERSGDVMISLKPGWQELTNRATDSNSGETYNTHVPLIFYGWKMGRQSIYRRIDMTDIAPTISSLLQITRPNGSSGDPIGELIQ